MDSTFINGAIGLRGNPSRFAKATLTQSSILLHVVRAERLARRIEAIRAASSAGDSKTIVKVIIQDEQGRVLILKDAGSKWDDLPGGHLKVGENYAEGLIREVYEETGIRLTNAMLYRTQQLPTPPGGKMLLFKARVDNAKVKVSEEHSGATWVKRNELGRHNLGRYAKDVEAVAGNQREFHSVARSNAKEEHKRAALKALALAEHAVAKGDTSHPVDRAGVIGAMLGLLSAGGVAAYLAAHRTLANGEGAPQEIDLPQAEGQADSRTPLLEPAVKDTIDQLELEKKAVEREQVERGTVIESEISKRLALKAKELEGARWERVADTEATATYGAAALRVLDVAGFKTVRWSQLDRPTKRHTHHLNEEQGEQPLGFVFQNGQSHPGDSARGPEENMNCLCQLLGVTRK